MPHDYYTYAYLRDDGTPYYIGKGRGNRAYSIAGRKMHRRPKDRSKILLLKQNLSEAEAFRHEVYMIAVFGRKDLGTGILRNLSDGGEGSKKRRFTPCGEAQKEANRLSMLARYANGLRMDGEHNPRAKTWEVTYQDGTVVVVKGLQKWAKENGYNKLGLSKLRKQQWRKYRDLISIREVREPEPSTP